MSEIYVNTTLSGVSNSAMEMGDIEPAKETDYKTQEDHYETLQFKHNTPQCQTEPARMDRMGPTKCSVSCKATLRQCSVFFLILLAVSTISGVVVYKLTNEDMKDVQLEIQSRLSSALSNQSKSFQDQITLIENKMRQNVLILEQQMQDNVTVLEQQMKDNDLALAEQTENDINNLKGNMSSNITILNNKLDGVESEQNHLADRFDDRSTSIAAFTATYPAYYGRSYSSNYYTLNFSRTIYNLGGNFNSSTGMFTCTKPGTYYFSVFLVKKRSSDRINQVYCSLYKNYSIIILTWVNPTDDDTDIGNAQAANSAVIHLNTGDFVYLRGCGSVSYMEFWSSFSGFLLYPDA